VRRLLLAALAALWLGPASAQQSVVNFRNAVCDPTNAQNCLVPSASGQINVNDVSTPTTGTGGVTAVTVGTSSAQALAAASGNRLTMLALQNVSASASIACNLGGTAALNTAGNFQIGPGQMLTWNSTYIPQDAINCIASAASTPLTVMAK